MQVLMFALLWIWSCLELLGLLLELVHLFKVVMVNWGRFVVVYEGHGLSWCEVWCTCSCFFLFMWLLQVFHRWWLMNDWWSWYVNVIVVGCEPWLCCIAFLNRFLCVNELLVALMFDEAYNLCITMALSDVLICRMPLLHTTCYGIFCLDYMTAIVYIDVAELVLARYGIKDISNLLLDGLSHMKSMENALEVRWWCKLKAPRSILLPFISTTRQ